MRILVIEDQIKLAQSIVRGLKQEGYGAEYETDGTEALEQLKLRHQDFDLVVLDIQLPGTDGYQILSEMRERHIMIPVIMLTAKDTVQDRVRGLDSGADDYIVKPFAFAELLSRIRALARRPALVYGAQIEVGTLTLHPASHEVYTGQTRIDVTLKEYRMLEYLMTRAGQAVSRQELADHVWDSDLDPLSRVMDVHINNLRNKLSAYEGTTIETVRGIGYRIGR